MATGELVYKFQRICQRYLPQRALGIYPEGKGEPRGKALVSYLPLPLIGDPACFRGHSNVWESSEIVRIFNRLGYSVDLIAWDDTSFVPTVPYDVVFDIHRNLVRCSSERTKAIFHVTGSNPEFSNQAESARLNDLKKRRGVEIGTRRAVEAGDQKLFAEGMARADLITLIGNDVTEATFPGDIRQKMRQVVATGTLLPEVLESTRLTHRPVEFLWFNGGGAVLKGLDLVLEIFARNPELTLHVVGPYLKERDFVAAYRTELFETSNIRSHGFLFPADRRFVDIASRTRAFISPSASEGISTAAITCMQAGLVPIISKNCGISLSGDAGILLEDCTVATIERAVQLIAAEDGDAWSLRAENARRYARESYSRTVFSQVMEEAIVSVVHQEQDNIHAL
ncbi:MAG: glycosyltransferase [Desulfuromonadaceae bacterium]|nr:glycosyltransferase [Desulfuromonadaceae bacterium]